MTRLRFLTIGVMLLTAAMVVLAVVLALVVSGLRDASAQNHTLAIEAKGLSAAIQSQRTESVRSGCQAQNARHRHTVRALDRILKAAQRHSPRLRRAQIRESRASTVLLINQLAPKQNCAAAVRRATTTRQAHPSN